LSQIEADVKVKKEAKDPSNEKSPDDSDQPAEKVVFIDFREPFTVRSCEKETHAIHLGNHLIFDQKERFEDRHRTII
jgi:hypothetical protein